MTLPLAPAAVLERPRLRTIVELQVDGLVRLYSTEDFPAPTFTTPPDFVVEASAEGVASSAGDATPTGGVLQAFAAGAATSSGAAAPTVLEQVATVGVGATGGGIWSANPLDGIYPAAGAWVPPGIPWGTVYQAVDGSAQQASRTPLEVATPLAVPMRATALAVRPYMGVRYTDDHAAPILFRWRLFVQRPGEVGASSPALEVWFAYTELQWWSDDGPAVEQRSISSRVATGELALPEGSLVCVELATCNEFGEPVADGNGIALGAVNFHALVHMELAA